MPKFELEKVAFVNPDDLTETVTLSTILEGAPSATRSFVEEEPEAYITEDNQEIKDGQIFTLTVATRDNSLTQLMTWADNGTKLTICGYAYDKFLQIDNAYLVARAESNERKVHVMSARKAGDIGYDDDGKLDTEFMMSANGLNMFYWQEGATTNLAAGWEKTGGSTTWSSGTQTLTTTGVSEVSVYRELYFPFDAKEITFFVNVTSITDTTNIRIQFYYYDSGDSTIGTSGGFITSTGLISYTDEIPANTEYIQCRISVEQDDSVTFENPGLSIGTSTTYISQ